MHDARFDALTRTLTAEHSRRGVTRLLTTFTLSGSLALLGVADARSKRKKKKKKKPVATTPPPANPCAGRVDGTACGTGKQCSRQDCVTGIGTCAAGARTCDRTRCNEASGQECYCAQTFAGGTRCARIVPNGLGPGYPCECESDDDCRDGTTSLGPHAFCAWLVSGCFSCIGGAGMCVDPCPG